MDMSILGTSSSRYRLLRQVGNWQPLFEIGQLEVPPTMKDLADEKQKQIDAAKQRAASRPKKQVSPDSPDWEKVTLEDAVTLMEIFMWEGEARYGFTVSSEGTSVMARVACPQNSDVREYAGMVAFTFGSSLDHAMRKVSQLHNGDFDEFWKKDTYAK